MGKAEILAMVAAMGALLGMQTSDAPIEGELIEMTRVLISTTRGEFEGFCAERGVDSVVSFEPSDHERVTCAWLDAASYRVWHAAVHFDGASPQPVKADAGSNLSRLSGSRSSVLSSTFSNRNGIARCSALHWAIRRFL